MNFKTEIVPQVTVMDQVKGLLEQKAALTSQIEQLEHKLQQTEASIAENDHLTAQVTILLDESIALFEEESKRKTEYYPDLMLASLVKALALAETEAPKT